MRRRFGLISIFVILLAGCSKVFDDRSENIIRWSFSSEEKSSKVQISPIDITNSSFSWEAGDRIGIFVEGFQYNRLFWNIGNSLFEGSIIQRNETADLTNYYAYSPWTRCVEDGMTVSGTLPELQSAPYDPKADYIITSNPVSAPYDEEDMPDNVAFSFDQHLFSILRISFKNTDDSINDEILTGITIEADTKIAGPFSFDFSRHPVQVSYVESEGVNHIRLIYPEGGRPKIGTEEHVVYIVARPSIINSLVVTVSTETRNISVSYAAENEKSALKLLAGKQVALPLITLSTSSHSSAKRKIILWGDSITGTDFLAAVKNELEPMWEVIRAGVGGDNTLQIASRQGGIQMIVDKPFIIPASSKTKVQISGLYASENQDGEQIPQKVQATIWFTDPEPMQCPKLNPVIINGVECIISYQNGKYYLQRNTDSFEDTQVNAGDYVYTYAQRTYTDVALSVIYMGTNGSYKDYETLVHQHQKMIDFIQSNGGDYIVLGYHYNKNIQRGCPTWSPEYVSAMTTAFGDHFVDLRTVGNQNGVRLLKETGLITDASQIGASDLEALSNGEWPILFSPSNNVHPTKNGAYAIAILLHDRMKELGID